MTSAPVTSPSRGATRGRRPWPAAGPWHSAGSHSGFTLIEVLIAMGVLTIALVAIAGMFPTGYRQVTDAGRMTLAVTAARQILEDVRSLPFDNLDNLNGFDSDNGGTQPADDPERAAVRRWRYALAGDGAGFGFTPAELDDWQTLSPFGGRAAVQAQRVGGGPCVGGTLCQVTVTVSVEALVQSVQISTVLVRM
jgi:prepilin-type N-terminal cleavage/methylation domain-containing protein